MNRSLKIPVFLFVSVFAVLAAIASSQTAFARALTVRSQQTLPVSVYVYLPCTGEWMHYSGDLHVNNHVTISDSGSTHVVYHINGQNLNGVGLSSGDAYRVVYVNNIRRNQDVDGLPAVNRLSIRLTFVGQGSGNNVDMLINISSTVNANGTVTNAVTSFEMVCR